MLDVPCSMLDAPCSMPCPANLSSCCELTCLLALHTAAGREWQDESHCCLIMDVSPTALSRKSLANLTAYHHQLIIDVSPTAPSRKSPANLTAYHHHQLRMDVIPAAPKLEDPCEPHCLPLPLHCLPPPASNNGRGSCTSKLEEPCKPHC